MVAKGDGTECTVSDFLYPMGKWDIFLCLLEKLLPRTCF